MLRESCLLILNRVLIVEFISMGMRRAEAASEYQQMIVLRMYHAKMLHLTAVLWHIPPAWKSPEIGAGLMSAGIISGIRGIRMSHHPELSQCRPRRMITKGAFMYGVQSVYYVLEGIQERAEYLSYMPERPGIMGFISLAVL